MPPWCTGALRKKGSEQMKMKKRLCFFLAALLMLSLSLVGCDPETDAPASSGTDGGDAVTDEGGEGTEEQEFWV